MTSGRESVTTAVKEAICEKTAQGLQTVHKWADLKGIEKTAEIKGSVEGGRRAHTQGRVDLLAAQGRDQGLPKGIDIATGIKEGIIEDRKNAEEITSIGQVHLQGTLRSQEATRRAIQSLGPIKGIGIGVEITGIKRERIIRKNCLMMKRKKDQIRAALVKEVVGQGQGQGHGRVGVKRAQRRRKVIVARALGIKKVISSSGVIHLRMEV